MWLERNKTGQCKPITEVSTKDVMGNINKGVTMTLSVKAVRPFVCHWVSWILLCSWVPTTHPNPKMKWQPVLCVTLRAVPQGLHHLTWLSRVKNQCRAPALWHWRMLSRHSRRASSTAQPNTMPPSTTRDPLWWGTKANNNIFRFSFWPQRMTVTCSKFAATLHF